MEIKITFDRTLIAMMAKNIQKNIDEAVAETLRDMDGIKTLQQEYDKSPLNKKTFLLYNSYIQEKTDTSLRIYSDVVYARIQDQGGWAGRNHASYIPPTFYATNTSEALKEEFITKLKQRLAK